MMKRVPSKRISAANALDEWRNQCDSMSDIAKAWPLRLRKEPWLVNLTRDGITALGHGARTLFGWVTSGV